MRERWGQVKLSVPFRKLVDARFERTDERLNPIRMASPAINDPRYSLMASRTIFDGFPECELGREPSVVRSVHSSRFSGFWPRTNVVEARVWAFSDARRWWSSRTKPRPMQRAG